MQQLRRRKRRFAQLLSILTVIAFAAEYSLNVVAEADPSQPTKLSTVRFSDKYGFEDNLKAYRELADHTQDVDVLHQLYVDYPETELGRRAYDTRHDMLIRELDARLEALAVKQSNARAEAEAFLTEFHRFVERYQDVEGVVHALNRVYALYVKLDDVSLYADFANRYSVQPLNYAAIQTIYTKEAERILGISEENGSPKASIVEECDKYLSSYPESGWTPAIRRAAHVRFLIQEAAFVESLTEQKEKDTEQKEKDTEQKDKDRQLERHLNRLVGDAQQSLGILLELRLPGSGNSLLRDDALYHQSRLERIDSALNTLYLDSPSRVVWNSHKAAVLQRQQISDILRSIESEIRRTRVAIVKTLRVELEQVRKNQDRNNQLVISAVKKVGDDLDKQVAGFRKDMNENFAKTITAIDKVGEAVQQVERRIGELDATLGEVRKELQNSNALLNTIGEATIENGQKLDAIDKELKKHTKLLTPRRSSRRRSRNPFKRARKYIEKRVTNPVVNAIGRFRNATEKELSNLTIKDIVEALKNPGDTTLEAFKRFDKARIDETNSAIDQIKKEAGYKGLQKKLLGKLLEEPTADDQIEVKSDEYTKTITKVIYVNGMLTTKKDAIESGERLAKFLKHPVTVILNPTCIESPFQTGDAGAEYGRDDLSESIYDRLWPAAAIKTLNEACSHPLAFAAFVTSDRRLQENRTTRLVSHILYHTGNDERIAVVAHSQGTGIVRNAFLALELLSKHSTVKQRISACFAGSYLNRGNEIWVKPTKFQYTMNPKDPVPKILGLNGGGNVDALADGNHGFIDYYLDKCGAPGEATCIDSNKLLFK